MDAALLLLIAALFVGVLILRSLIGLAMRFALFLAVAAFLLHRQQGVAAADLVDADRLAVLVLSATVGMVGTKIAAFALFRESKLRFVLTPITGIVITAVGVGLLTA